MQYWGSATGLCKTKTRVHILGCTGEVFIKVTCSDLMKSYNRNTKKNRNKLSPVYIFICSPFSVFKCVMMLVIQLLCWCTRVCLCLCLGECIERPSRAWTSTSMWQDSTASVQPKQPQLPFGKVQRIRKHLRWGEGGGAANVSYDVI